MDSEKTLLRKARSWDMDALARIYDTYSPGVYRYAVRLLGNADLAEECVAETFRRFLQTLHNGGGPRRFLKAYLYRVAHNWISDHYRRQVPEGPLDEAVQAVADGRPDHEVIFREQQAAVRRALAQLTPEQRQVVVLRFLEEWSLAEVAQAMGKSVGAVKALQHRALNALRSLLQDMEEVTVHASDNG